jgi:hypothetical protein
MSVKAFENGRWVVKSSDNDSRYKVAWTLKEKQINVEKNTKTEVVQREEQNKDDAEIGEPLN